MANQILTLFFGKGLVHLGPMGVVESELGVLKCYIRLSSPCRLCTWDPKNEKKACLVGISSLCCLLWVFFSPSPFLASNPIFGFL